jgi:hypothetical protein
MIARSERRVPASSYVSGNQERDVTVERMRLLLALSARQHPLVVCLHQRGFNSWRWNVFFRLRAMTKSVLKTRECTTRRHHTCAPARGGHAVGTRWRAVAAARR